MPPAAIKQRREGVTHAATRRSHLRALLLRVLGGLAMLWVLSLLVYLLAWITPGDLAFNILGLQHATPAKLAEVNARYGFDRPILVQYFDWLQHALAGDFGDSIRTRSAVSRLIAERIGPTALLAALSLLVAVLVALPLSLAAALHHGRGSDQAIGFFTILGLSAPSFALALLFLVLFAVWIPIFPLYGIGTGGLDTLWHLLLPAAVLATGAIAVLVKLSRAALIAELAQDYIVFALSRGLGRIRVALLLLRGAAPQIITAISLLAVMLSGGAIFIESAFAVPGIGKLLHESILYKDMPVIQALVLLNGGSIICAALGADLLIMLIDPRRSRASK